jgi:hypothetical protein
MHVLIRYKAGTLAKDILWYEQNIMGSGPFVFVEHVRGSHLVGKHNPKYWGKGKSYLVSTAPCASAVNTPRVVNLCLYARHTLTHPAKLAGQLRAQH